MADSRACRDLPGTLLQLRHLGLEVGRPDLQYDVLPQCSLLAQRRAGRPVRRILAQEGQPVGRFAFASIASFM